jgi:Suppressor of fused protein (SUFU)
VAEETSPGGSRIYRHQRSASDEFQVSGGDPDLITAIEAHLDHSFGKTGDWVFHEIVSPTIHLDVHLVPPSDDFPFQRLVTSGMAEAPMSVPEGFEETAFAELTIALPSEWPLDQEALENESVYWPIRLLKALARLPHDYSTFLWYGHTIPNGDPPAPYAENTDLCGAIIIPPLLAPSGFGEVQLADGRRVRILGVLPLHGDEMQLKLDKGADALYDRLEQNQIADVIDPSRPSVAPKKGRFFKR